jgi:hypothetical protein
MTSQLLFDAAGELALKIATELRAAPLYVIDHPSDQPAPYDAVAYAVNGLTCPSLKRHLIETGRWQGHGPIIAFNTNSLDPGLTEAEFWPTFLHELAHSLPVHTMRDPLEHELAQCDLAAFVGKPIAPPAWQPAWAPSHDRTFHRISIHLWTRAFMEGLFVDFDLLCGGDRYGLPHAYSFWRALGAEAILMKNLPFSEIISRPEPEAFSRLWDGRLAEWIADHRDDAERTIAQDRAEQLELALDHEPSRAARWARRRELVQP